MKFTAQDARELVSARRQEADRESAKQHKGRRKTTKQAVALRQRELFPLLLMGIKAAAGGGQSRWGVGYYDHHNDKDEIEVSAMELAMKRLRGRPYYYKVTEEECEGSSGEGMNFSDFYTHHLWVISW